MEILNWIIGNWGILPVGAIVTWFVKGRFFDKKELESKELQNNAFQAEVMVQNLDIYKRLFEDLEEQILKAKDTIKQLEAEIELMDDRYKELKRKCDELE